MRTLLVGVTKGRTTFSLSVADKTYLKMERITGDI